MPSSSEHVLIKTNIFALVIRLQKASCKTAFKTSLRHLAKTSSRHLQDVLKTSSKHPQGVLPRSLQGVFKTSSRRLVKTSSRHLQGILKTFSLLDIFKTYHKVKLFLLTSLRDVFNTFVRPTAKTVIYRRIYLCHTPDKFMVSAQKFL